MKIWVWTDMHVGRLATADIQSAIDDIKNNVGVDMVLGLGDMVDDGLASQMDSYLSIRNNSGLKPWYELLGNHDVDYSMTFNEALSKIGRPPLYEVRVGNIVFIMISDIGQMDGYTVTCGDVKNDVWQTLEQRLDYWNKQKANVILCTHQPPYNSVYSSTESCMYQVGKDWGALLDKYKVDAWLHGHIHSSSIYSPWTVTWHNCKIVSCSSLANWCAFGSNPIDSKVLFISEGSETILAKYRNHETQSWNSTYDITIPLRYAFDPNWTPEEVPEEVPQIPQLPEMITEMIGGTLAIIILAEFLRKLHRERKRRF